MHRFWCLQLFIHVSLQFLTSLKLGHCSKLNWPKRVSAVYWLFGTLFYPCIDAQLNWSPFSSAMMSSSDQLPTNIYLKKAPKKTKWSAPSKFLTFKNLSFKLCFLLSKCTISHVIHAFAFSYFLTSGQRQEVHPARAFVHCAGVTVPLSIHTN